MLGQPPRIPNCCEGPGEPGLVSVLIPTYNRGYILGSAIESVLSQTYRPIEIIVVDDGSTDDTKAVLDRFGSKIKTVYQDNAGLAGARNTGLALARGEFISFEDSDDIWLPWKLQAQVALMKAYPDVAICWTDMAAYDEKGRLISDRHLRTCYSAYRQIQMEETFPDAGTLGEIDPACPIELAKERFRCGDIFSAMFHGNLIHPPTVLLRRTQVAKNGGLDLTFTMTCEDYEFFWRIARYGRGAVIEAPSMHYRIGATDQITHSSVHKFLASGHVTALERTLARDRNHLHLPEATIRNCLSESHEWVGDTLLDSDRQSARRHFGKSISLNRRRIRPYAQWLKSLIPHPVVSGLKRMKRYLSPRKS